MPNYIKDTTLLIGTGPMAIDYAMVLKHLGRDFITIGRGSVSAKKFLEETGIKPVEGGLESFLMENKIQENVHIIVAVGPEQLMPVLKLLNQNNGISRVLVEKPAALSINELLGEFKVVSNLSGKTVLGYNRRFYASTLMAEKIIQEDGGLKSMHFEFTEWSHKIGPSRKPAEVKSNWFFANSTHVVDLAFFLAGNPIEWSSFSQPGSIDWHEKSVFCGAGITKKGALFSYNANWESAGRWSIELMTSKQRLYLRPMEKLFAQKLGTLHLEEVEIDYSNEIEFKPGLLLQVKAFYDFGDSGRLLSLKEQLDNSANIYAKMIS